MFEHLIKRRSSEPVASLSVFAHVISNVKVFKLGQKFDVGWEFSDLVVGQNEGGQVLEIRIFEQEL